MLILTRKHGESLHIGDDIKLTVLAIQGKQVKLGLDVPSSIFVYREELYLRVQEENKTASTSKYNDLGVEKISIDTRLGPREVTKDVLISFPRGLIGLERETSFVLLEIAENSPMFLLQSTITPELGFLLVDPYLYASNLSFQINSAQQAILEAKTSIDINVLVTVTIPSGEPEMASINLAGPIFINHVKRIALQVPQETSQSKVYIKDYVDKYNSLPQDQ